jgi:hypothetical protein
LTRSAQGLASITTLRSLSLVAAPAPSRPIVLPGVDNIFMSRRLATSGIEPDVIDVGTVLAMAHS